MSGDFGRASPAILTSRETVELGGNGSLAEMRRRTGLKYVEMTFEGVDPPAHSQNVATSRNEKIRVPDREE